MAVDRRRSANGSADPTVMADVVHERLRESILNATYRPNHRLVEEEVASELQVSRTPVREALVRLRGEGLVTQNKGWVVRDHSPSEIMQVIEARGAVESSAAYHAAQRLSKEEIGRLEDLVEQMEDPATPRVKVNELNTEFHHVITTGSRNPLLVQFARRTQINYWNFNQPVVFTPADDAVVNKQHRELIDALRSHDAEAAQRIAREHVDMTARILATALGLS